MMPPINDIDCKAAEWAVKADSEALSPEQQAALDAWLDEDRRHLGAYLRARGALARVERLGAAAQGWSTRPSRQAAWPASAPKSRRRLLLVGSIAASLAIFTVAGAVWQAATYEAIYTTGIGQTRSIALPDGTSVTMNTDTEARVQYGLTSRNVELVRGEVLFDVAKSSVRPFMVKARDAQVRDIGTSFEVTALDDRPLEVLVREGAVEISTSQASRVVAVLAGSRAVGRPDGAFAVEALEAGQIARDLAWREGHIYFRRQTLAAAAKEFGRYSKVHIVIDDPAVANKTVSGMYVTTDPVGFAKAVAVILDLKVEQDGNELHLSQKGN